MTDLELGMTDMATRSRSGPVWKWAALLGFGIILYVVWRNYLFIEEGMLGPNFTIIHQAYDFNLFELPVILLVVAGLSMGLAVTWVSVRRALIWVGALYAFLALDLFGLRYYVTYVEPERLVVRQVRLETPKLDQTVRILHIADIQAGSIGEYQKVIFDRIESLQPDLIINTGDFLQVVPPATFESEWPKLHALIKRVNPRLGTYGVFGDTERELYRYQPEALKPLVMLSSREQRIGVGSGVINLHGLSLYQSKSGEWAMRSVEQWLEKSDPNDFRILFGHAPDYALSVAEAPIDLCLAGHTHGGQVKLPFYGPLVIDSEVPKEWAQGFRRVGIPYLNVSAGAGSNRRHSLPPIRFNCPTEMTLIELVPMRSIR
ncbi:metallophosphoesterase [Coraliomargarita sp. SDUM461003]|uniref:Metallophosphoesterase n=1 Tax=Thalassobacterium maritimum TaxID=3041265 RepID=A0ABU1AXX2_9BACT|nr:metallophosphoesterase [Coraliomargarita sp. SDUM461003]MDQ8209008.1 metallophosphoesterase [Coraliomargarita sp. SDUM461003]|tara:strand:- start:17713 stop:18834 length:1122 start_codon:yes stop_codon:yes gene_type:complete